MMPEPAPSNLEPTMANAIQSAASEVYPGDVVIRWVALVETMDTDGVRALIVSCQEGMRSWDTLGLLQFGIQVEQAVMTKDGG